MPLYVRLVTSALVLQLVSGQSDALGFPIPVDRAVLAAAAVAFTMHVDAKRFTFRPQPVHLCMLTLILAALCSSLWFDTWTDPTARFAIFDSLGLVPLVLFILAPVIYSTPERLDLLRKSLVGVGAYLGAVAVFEIVGPRMLVLPTYIADSSAGSFFGRARGPFLQPAVNGMALFVCGAVAGFSARQARGRRRNALVAVSLLDVIGMFLTLTRSVWIGGALGLVALAVLDRDARRHLVAAGATVAVLAGLLVLSVPSLQESVRSRLSDSESGIDRLNANAAAIRVVETSPLLGVGWGRFPIVEDDYVRQDDRYAITQTGIAVHNVPLGLAAELGTPVAVLWLAILGLVSRRLFQLRHGRNWWFAPAVMYAVCYLSVAMLIPLLSYPFTNSTLWLMFGLAGGTSLTGSSLTTESSEGAA